MMSEASFFCGTVNFTEAIYDLFKSSNLSYAGDKIEKNEIGGACGTYEGREMCAQGVGGEN